MMRDKELGVPLFRAIGASARCKLDDDQISLQRVVPVDIETMHLPPIVCTLKTAGVSGNRAAILRSRLRLVQFFVICN